MKKLWYTIGTTLTLVAGVIFGSQFLSGPGNVGAVTILPVTQGGTGLTTTPKDYILVGSSTGQFNYKLLTAGSNITISSSSNSITINSTGLGPDYPALATSTFLQISASTSLAYLGFDYPATATSTFVSKSATTSFPNLATVGTITSGV